MPTHTAVTPILTHSGVIAVTTTQILTHTAVTLTQVTLFIVTAGPKTLQAFVDGHWQLQLTIVGGVMCMCCAWAV